VLDGRLELSDPGHLLHDSTAPPAYCWYEFAGHTLHPMVSPKPRPTSDALAGLFCWYPGLHWQRPKLRSLLALKKASAGTWLSDGQGAIMKELMENDGDL